MFKDDDAAIVVVVVVVVEGRLEYVGLSDVFVGKAAVVVGLEAAVDVGL